MRYVACVALAAALMGVLPAHATIRISGDGGGQLGPYLKHLESLRRSGERVMIDGPCLSACTMVLGVVPRNRICVTSRAQFGFHAAWNPGQDGQEVTSPEGTQLLMQHYPQPVREWIGRRGGLTRDMKYLSGGELSSMYASCGASEGQAAATVSGPAPKVAGQTQWGQGAKPASARVTRASHAWRDSAEARR